jgi:dihydroxy-acid dehydratase
MIKAFSVPKEMHVHTGAARVFDTEDAALDSLIGRHGAKKVAPGEVVVIRYEGPRANGMPEMYFASAIIAADPSLNHTTALITDGRYSGAMKGPCIGHVTPEAIDGGPIALVEENDLIEINIPQRRLGIVGIGKKPAEPRAIDQVLAERREHWVAPPFRHTRGILSLYSRVATSSAEGGLMTPRDGVNHHAVPAAAEPVSHNESAHLELAGRRA